MPQTIFLALLVGLVLAFFSGALQKRLRGLFSRNPAPVWFVPAVLTAVFGGAALVAGAFRLPLALLVLA